MIGDSGGRAITCECVKMSPAARNPVGRLLGHRHDDGKGRRGA